MMGWTETSSGTGNQVLNRGYLRDESKLEVTAAWCDRPLRWVAC